jgi:hypothetical protein
MNLVKKFPIDTLVEIASQVVSLDDTNRGKEPPIHIGTKKVQEVKQGWFAKDADGGHSKINSVNTSTGTVKKITLSSGNFFYIDSNSTIDVGEELSEYAGLITSSVTSVDDAGTMDLYELILEGDGGLLINNVTIA